MTHVLGYAVLLVGCLFNGSFGVLHKLTHVSIPVLVLYFSIGCFVASELTIPVLWLLDNRVAFSPAGLGSGFSAYFAINFVFYTMQRAGVAVSMVGFCGLIILSSVLLENMLILDKHPSKPSMLAAALSLIAVALLGVFVSRQASDKRKAQLTSFVDQGAAGCMLPPEVTETPPMLDGDLKEQDLQEHLTSVDALESQTALPQHTDWVQIIVGLIGATVGFVSIKLWGKLDSSIKGVEFTWSFGIGILTSAMLFSPLVIAVIERRKCGLSDLGSRRDACVGITSGVLWGAANITMDVAIGQDVPLGTVNTVFQSAIVVSGLWGVYFKELVGCAPISLFFVSSAFFLCGVAGVAISF